MQNIFVENRKSAAITGVQDVIRFNDDVVALKTELGQLTIKGSNLKITKLDVENGNIEITGVIQNVGYANGKFVAPSIKRKK